MRRSLLVLRNYSCNGAWKMEFSALIIYGRRKFSSRRMLDLISSVCTEHVIKLGGNICAGASYITLVPEALHLRSTHAQEGSKGVLSQ